MIIIVIIIIVIVIGVKIIDMHAGTQFDAVMGLEIIEHVDEPQQFLKTLGSLTKSDGALFISTINRTLRGYALAILGAEQLTGVVPKGTHDWNKFLTPGKTTLCSACQEDPNPPPPPHKVVINVDCCLLVAVCACTMPACKATFWTLCISLFTLCYLYLLASLTRKTRTQQIQHFSLPTLFICFCCSGAFPVVST